MRNPTGEMPFLDHLEELRKRILLALGAVVVGFGAGWFVTRHFELIKRLEGPIVQFIPGGKLVVLKPTDPFMITLEFALVVGLLVASPVVLYQLWLFLAPALTKREKRAILPALGIGLFLFLGGAALGWFVVVGPAVKWLLTFEAGTFTPQITYDSYMQLVLQLLIGMGVAAELPLVMILLASLGLLSYRVYKKFRRYAVFLSFVGGAILSPTPEVVMMCVFTAPIYLLFEIGVFGAYLIERRKNRAARLAAMAGLLFLFVTPHRAHAQIPGAPPPLSPGGVSDVSRRGVTAQGGKVIDSATAKRLGMPTGPTRQFPTPDPLMQSLLDQSGFAATRFMADTARFDVNGQRIELGGHAASLRDDNNVEADRIAYDIGGCAGVAEGEPRLFQKGQAPLIAIRMQFSSCVGSERGVMDEAYTSFNELGANWFVRGHLAVDSSGKRLYAAKTEFTSCDLPDPHYHFVAGQVKWMQQSIMVARPAVLYIRDVPVAWLPFLFQDTKAGNRSSGILIPRFGFNDIVRPVRTYNRQLTNIGYFWAPNDYIDLTMHFDWYSNRYIQYGADFNYNWLDRFVRGGIHLNQQVQSGGSTNRTISWQHRQDFNATTSLTANINYASNTNVLQNNALSPALSTQGITSQVSLNKTFSWGAMTIGGTRNQSISDGSGTMTLPSFTISPRSFGIGRHFVFSPNFSANNQLQFKTPATGIPVVLPTGLDTIGTTSHARNSTVTLTAPLQFDQLSWNNTVAYNDQKFVGNRAVVTRVPDLGTADPNDSINVTTYRNGDFQTGVNWETSINLPQVFRTTYKVTPSVGVTNVTSGPFLLRTPASAGAWVVQGKKLQLGLAAAPTFFGFMNGVGPYIKFRYTLAPLISMHWSPAANVSAAYARAAGLTAGLAIPATSLASLQLHQTFEAKLKPAPGDTSTDPTHLPKKSLFSISTSALSYDFEQAKLPGHNGWTTQAVTNQFQSDLVQGLSVSTTHDLWEGVAGSDTSHFKPFLSNVNASFSLTGRTFRAIGALFGLVHRDTVTRGPALGTSNPMAAATSLSLLGQTGGMRPGISRGPFTATVNYSLTRRRPSGVSAPPVPTEGGVSDPFGFGQPFVPLVVPLAQSNIGLTMSFSPTPFWSVSWNTQYDFTKHAFQSQQIQLERDLHDWRARFDFVKNPNGNFALFFSVYLMSLPDIKFDYNQTTLQQTPLQP